MEIELQKHWIEQLAERGVKLRIEDRRIKVSPKGALGPEEVVFLREHFAEIYEAISGETFALEEESFSYAPPKPVISPVQWIERFRAHQATKSSYFHWPACALGLDEEGNRVTATPDVNPKGLPTLLEILERPENAGCELNIANAGAFCIRGGRRDGTDFEVVRLSYDGLPERSRGRK